MQDQPPLTLGAVGQHFGVPAWMVCRLFERGLLSPAPRVGAYRVVAVADLPLVERALREAGYLPETAEDAHVLSSSTTADGRDHQGDPLERLLRSAARRASEPARAWLLGLLGGERAQSEQAQQLQPAPDAVARSEVRG